MKARLNLSTVPLVSHRRFSAGSAAVGILALSAMLWLSTHAYEVWRSDREFRSRQQQLTSDIARLQAHRDELDAYFNRPENVKRRELAGYLNGLIEQRSFPWTKVFMDLEQSLPAGVHVVSIEPKLVGDEVQLRLIVEASSDDTKLKFLQAIESSPVFSRLEVQSESRPTREEGGDEVRVELTTWYSTI
jgi:Tfp pilus assembly protein PilN